MAGFQQLRVTREFDATGATVLGVGNQMLGSGKVFYVNGESYGPTGNDNNEGTNPQYPLATITQAVANCRQRTNDWIFIQGFYQTDTFPITLNKRNIHLIGIAPGGTFRGRALIDGDAAAAFETSESGGGVEMAGLRLGSSDAAYPCINIGANTYFMHIHDCTFGIYMPATDGIYGASGQYHMNGWTIEDCHFGTGLTGCGIECVNNVRSDIKNCTFMGYGDVGIKLDAGAIGEISGNKFFKVNAGAEGCAITLGASTSNGLITWNSAAEDDVACTAVPYLDNTGATGATANAWGINYSGKDAVAPTAGG